MSPQLTDEPAPNQPTLKLGPATSSGRFSVAPTPRSTPSAVNVPPLTYTPPPSVAATFFTSVPPSSARLRSLPLRYSPAPKAEVLDARSQSVQSNDDDHRYAPPPCWRDEL